jgi:CubicO group peptidase (beta-lactamase class C family)
MLAGRLDSVPARLAKLAEEYHVPGVSVAVRHGDETFEYAHGMANVRAGIEATPDTLFLIGSITKVYTTTLLMRHVEAGRIRLDTRIREVVPNLELGTPELTDRVTLRHLLTHTSGIPGDFLDESAGRGEEAVTRFVEHLAGIGQLHPPGEMMSYCNSGFSLAGRVLEVLNDRTWDEILRRDLLDPLGLATPVTWPEDALRYRVAVAHVRDADTGVTRLSPMWTEFRAGAPAGFTPYATARDVVAFARLHLDGGVTADGTRLLSPESVAAMQTKQVDTLGGAFEGDGWGLGWARFQYDGERVVGHNGGSSAVLRVLPERRFAVAVLTNIATGSQLADALIEELVRTLFDLRIESGVPPRAQVDDATLDAVVGTYAHLGFTIDVARRDDGLAATWRFTDVARPFEMQLTPLDANTLAVSRPGERTPSKVSVVGRRPDGTPAYLHVGLRAYRRVE